MRTDNALISDVRDGDTAAFAELFDRHHSAALRYARTLTRRAVDAEDIVAESFTSVFDQLRRGGGPRTSFRAYLFTSIRNKLYDAPRREVLLDTPELQDTVAESSVGAEDTRADAVLVARAFRRLRATHQHVLVQLDVHGERPGKVAGALGISTSALAMRAARARAALAEAYLVEHTCPGAAEDCRVTAGRLGRYVRGALSTAHAQRVARHLDGCERCSAAAAELTDVNRSLRAVPPIVLFGPAGFGAHVLRFRGWRAVGRGVRRAVTHHLATTAVGGTAVALATTSVAVALAVPSHAGAPMTPHAAVSAMDLTNTRASARPSEPVEAPRRSTVPARLPGRPGAPIQGTRTGSWPAPAQGRPLQRVTRRPTHSPRPTAKPPVPTPTVTAPSSPVGTWSCHPSPDQQDAQGEECDVVTRVPRLREFASPQPSHPGRRLPHPAVPRKFLGTRVTTAGF